MRRLPFSQSEHSSRRGFLLVIVMVVIVIASLICYQFADRMTTERQIADLAKRESQALQAAESAIDYSMALVTDSEFDPAELPMMLPEEYAWQVIEPGSEEAEVPNDLMCVLVSRQLTLQTGALTYGLASEAGKINLNALAEMDVSEENQRNVLLFALPDMTETLADTILDFIDSDTTPRDFGTESDDGELIIRNAPLQSLDDLLAIPEITPDLLYGEDANRNGFLDPNEDDADVRAPFDNADGELTLGWAESLTLWSRESNLRLDGTPKINLNSNDLEQLQADLEVEFGSELAEFVIAYRENGPANRSGSGGNGDESEGAGDSDNGGMRQQNPGRGGGRGGGGRGGNSGGGNSGNGGSGGGGNSGSQSFSSPNSGFDPTRLLTVQSEDSSSGGDSEGSGSGSGSGQYELQSPYELIDATVEQDNTTLNSPWSSDDLSFVPFLEEAVTITDGETRHGRIDMNYASHDVLLGLPNITETTINEILNGAGSWISPAELLQSGEVNVEQIMQLEPFLTAQSRTYRFQAIGFWKTGGPVVRLDVVLDLAGSSPVILQQRNLTPLGPGFTPAELAGEEIVDE